MTYLQFHFVFILPPILILLWLLKDWLPKRSEAVWSLVGLALIALVYTTPWDNYLVWRGVWGYGEGNVLFTIGHVPVEEYLFFVLQPVLTGLWLYYKMRNGVTNRRGSREQLARWIGGAFWGIATVAGGAMLFQEETLYLGLILVWAGPVLLGQWLYTGHWFWRLRRLWAVAVAVPTLYLWMADRVALHLGIWFIADRYTTGWHLLGLPIEEAAFFLLTNLLIVQGLLMLLRVGASESWLPKSSIQNT